MRSIGHVSDIEPGSAVVLLGRHAQCTGCGACIAASDTRQRSITATNEIGAIEGDMVEIEIPPGRLVVAAVMIFMLPVAAALGGGYLGYRSAGGLGIPQVAGGIVLGCLAFAGSFLLLKALDKTGRGGGRPRIVRILREHETEGRC